MTMLAAALDYAAHGWPVFPCHPKSKRPLTPAKDGDGGLKLATADQSIIRSWWNQWPKALIGVPTGRAIGAFVLDLDAGTDEETGEIFTVEDLEKAIAVELRVAIQPSVIAATPRGGRHFYFALPPDGDPPGNRGGILNRVDVRGEGGYVIVPPSTRPDGVAYRWIKAPW